MNSIWSKTSEPISFEPLKGHKSVDVLIIGGGLTGLLCTYMLKNVGVDCVLVEAQKICSGITRNTTAKITFAHGLFYDKLINRFGKETAQLYLEAQLCAAEQYACLCQKIPCDYESKDSYVYSLDNRKKVEKEAEALNSLGIRAEVSETPLLPFQTVGAVCVRNQAQFHPLKFAFALAKQLPVYENTKVLELLPGKAITQYGEILFQKAIVATHFPLLNKHGAYFLKMYQHRSYVLALDNAPSVNGIYVDEAEKGLSLRSWQNLLLLGGGSHRTGKTGGNWKELEEFAKIYFSEARIVGKWATQDCMTLDGVPYIGSYSKSTPNLYVATGFNKWGITSAMVSAMILSDTICGKNNPYASVFSPSRSILCPQLFLNTVESLVGLLKPTAPRCPHLGCALKYNPAEHSWDCPCHGSRFSKSGKLLDNPATDDKKI